MVEWLKKLFRENNMNEALITQDNILAIIITIRGENVIIDMDLAELYGTTTKALNQAVKRRINKFPSDFMITLTKEEKDELVTNCDRFKNLKHSSSLPKAFTEHGALMAASVFNTPRAVEVSVFIVRAFVKLRKVISENKELAREIAQLERRMAEHDDQLIQIVQALKELLNPDPPPKIYRIGFQSDQE